MIMEIAEIRGLTNLKQKEFCMIYGIPYSTLRKWETAPDKKEHRNCPVYVLSLLERAVREDIEEGRIRPAVSEKREDVSFVRFM